MRRPTCARSWRGGTSGTFSFILLYNYLFCLETRERGSSRGNAVKRNPGILVQRSQQHIPVGRDDARIRRTNPQVPERHHDRSSQRTYRRCQKI